MSGSEAADRPVTLHGVEGRLVAVLLQRLGPFLDAPGLNRVPLLPRLWRSAERPLWDRLSRKDLLLVKIQGVSMYIRCRPEFWKVYLLGPHEPYTTELFKRSVQPGSIVLDIGAHFGLFSMLASERVGPQGRIHAFEPDPRNLEVLRRNAALPGRANIEVRADAVCAGEGPRTLILSESSFCNAWRPHVLSKEERRVEVSSVSIDHALGAQSVDVVKIDIEGGELAALKGMRRTLRRSRPAGVFVELNPAGLRRNGASSRELLREVVDQGFHPLIIDERRRMLREPVEELLEEAERDEGWVANLLCTRHRTRGGGT